MWGQSKLTRKRAESWERRWIAPYILTGGDVSATRVLLVEGAVEVVGLFFCGTLII